MAGVIKGYGVAARSKQDVMQDALHDIVEEVRSPEFVLRVSFSSLIRRITLCKCVNWVRKEMLRRRFETTATFEPGAGPADRSEQPAMMVASKEPGPEEQLLHEERQALVQCAIGQLRDSCRKLIGLCIHEGLSYHEVARLQNRSVDAVRQQWCECMRQLRRLCGAGDRAARPGRRPA